MKWVGLLCRMSMLSPVPYLVNHIWLITFGRVIYARSQKIFPTAKIKKFPKDELYRCYIEIWWNKINICSI
jgi:hypothetical protein